MAIAGGLPPAWANVASRAVAVLSQATLRRDYIARARSLAGTQGLGWCLLVFVVHLTLTTGLVVAFVGAGAHPVPAKAAAQLLGYLATFVAVDTALLTRAFEEGRV
jgi:hypothetical protein